MARGHNLLLGLENGHVAEPDFLAIGQDNPRVGPVGLIARDAVAAVAHFEDELRRAAQVHPHRHARHCFSHQRRLERLLVANGDGEDDRPSAGAV